MKNTTIHYYLKKTESAMLKLFEGISSYIEILNNPDAAFVTSYTDDADLQSQYEVWCCENSIAKAREAEKKFVTESFALSVLCGSVLQVAEKAIELFSKNKSVAENFGSVIKESNKNVKFCCGRLIRGVPLGLIIYAGRNQHTHFDDYPLREPNKTVFELLAKNHDFGPNILVDPAFDLTDSRGGSFANNITAIIGWRSYSAYEKDMKNIL